MDSLQSHICIILQTGLVHTCDTNCPLYFTILQTGLVHANCGTNFPPYFTMLQTGLVHACANGFLPILELLAEVEEVDVNLPDNEGNTALIFASQAGKLILYICYYTL